MKQIRPHKIYKRSTLGIYSPSEPIIERRVSMFERGLAMLKANGFEPRLAPHALASTTYMAGSPRERADDIHALLGADDIDLLISAWGGKSANQLIELIDYRLITDQRKPILGFSDPCVILNAISARTGLITFYGPNVVGKLHETTHSDLHELQYGFGDANIIGNTDAVKTEVIRSGKSVGRLIGGNLSTFVLGVVTSSIPEDYYRDSILFWEDMSLPPQLIDQLLTAMINHGVFKSCSGMVIGEFISQDPAEWKTADPFDVILERFKDSSFPILYAPTFGHAQLENPILPIGAICKLDAARATLTLESEVVEL